MQDIHVSRSTDQHEIALTVLCGDSKGIFSVRINEEPEDENEGNLELVCEQTEDMDHVTTWMAEKFEDLYDMGELTIGEIFDHIETSVYERFNEEIS